MASKGTFVYIDEDLKAAVTVAVTQRENRAGCFSLAVNEALRDWLKKYLESLE